ncbi:MAG: hypothetical protein Q9174_002220 [Haloplaca sp. 1 TL-2023]
MAAAQMQRPYQPVYHTPQSNSPASVASSQSHDPNNRLYGQPPSQMQQPMYAYPQQYPNPMTQNYQAAYASHAAQQQPQQHQQQQQQQQQQPPPQQHPLSSQSQMMMSHQQPQHQPMHHQQAQPQSQNLATNSPRPKAEPQSIQQRPLENSSVAQQRSNPGPMNGNHNQPSGPQTNGQLHPAQGGSGVNGAAANGGPPGAPGINGANPSAAPGPIPATTPLVVHTDTGGVQWIAFEYSRDRVKMEYRIRCDVESVNVDSLAADFKTENCVYPRACGAKDTYRGNRLNYETECNTVGWALAELNPCLRGKRGLIQRAVDSWRNSNQDPRLRSRRVRRQAKINTRKQHPGLVNPGPGPGGPGAATGVTPSQTPMTAPVQRPQPSSMNMGQSQLHHHHAHPDGSVPAGPDDVSAGGNYTPQQQHHQVLPKQQPLNDIRQAHVFPGYANYPTQASQANVALAPHIHDGIDGPLSNHPGAHPSNSSTAIAASLPLVTKLEDGSHDDSKASHPPLSASTQVFSDVPEAKRRKFIVVDDIDRNNPRVRVRATLDNIDMSEIPDSYRKANSVYPRSYYPIQMQSPKRRASKGNRFFQDDEEGGGEQVGEVDDSEDAVMGRTLVPVPMLEGGDEEMAVPKIGRAKKRREEMVNDLGYRMSWNQSRAFAGRTMFLQRALDAYRNKMRSATSPAPHLETRIGKRKWLERKGKAKSKTES